MSDKKHIDRLFQENLKDFDVTPHDSVWENIHTKLHKEEERRRKIIPLWWKLAGVAALLALLLTVGIKLTSDGFNSTNTIVDTEKQSSDHTSDTDLQKENHSNDVDNSIKNSSKIDNDEISTSDDFTNDKAATSSKKDASTQNSTQGFNSEHNRIVDHSTQGTSQKNTSDKTTNIYNKSSQNDQVNAAKDAIVNIGKDDDKISNQNSANQKKELSEYDNLIKDSKSDMNSSVTNASEKIENIISEDNKDEDKMGQTIEEALAETNSEEEKDEKEKKLNRWNISPNVAPVYFNSLGKGSSLDEQFVDNNNDSEVSLSYGVGGSYALNDRLKLRAGINKVDMGYSTQNVIAFRSIDSTSNARVDIRNVSMNDNAQNMTYLSAQSLNRNITPEIINTKTQGAINQRFGFIEVPLEVEYALINNKIGVNVIGGFSTLIVDKNEVYSVIDGNQTLIGEASNINNMSYSANLGLGFNYNISEKIKVNVEPTFKYQINTFNNSSGDFQPYFIGVYTGLSYKF